MILLTVIWIGKNSNAWQTHLIKRELRGYVDKMNSKKGKLSIYGMPINDPDHKISGIFAQFDDEDLAAVATAFAYAGEAKLALQLVDRIIGPRAKADALRRIAEFHVEIGDKEKATALLSDAIKTMDQPGYYESQPTGAKVYSLCALALPFARLGEKEKAKSLLSQGIIEAAEQISDDISKGAALKKIVESYIEIVETTKDGILLEDAIQTADRISYPDSKIDALREIAQSYAGRGDKEKARALLGGMIQMTDRISYFQVHPLSKIAETYAGLGDKEKARALLEDAVKRTYQRIDLSSRIDDTEGRVINYNSIVDDLSEAAESYAALGDKEKARALLEEASKTADRITKDRVKVYDQCEIAESYAAMEDRENARAMMEDASKTTDRIGEDRVDKLSPDDLEGEFVDTMRYSGIHNRANSIAGAIFSDDGARGQSLEKIAKSYARLGETMKDAALLKEAIKTADRIRWYPNKAYALSAIARSYARLGETMKDAALLKEAIKTADRIRDDSDKPARKPIDSGQIRLSVFNRLMSPDLGSGKNQALDAILSSKLALSYVGRLRSLTFHYRDERGKVMALARILIAISHPELSGKKREYEIDEK